MEVLTRSSSACAAAEPSARLAARRARAACNSAGTPRSRGHSARLIGAARLREQGWHVPGVRCRAASLDLDSLMPGSIDGDLRSLHEEAGVDFDDNGAPISFFNDAVALEALSESVAVFDRTHWARIRVAGPARLDWLAAASGSPALRALVGGRGAEAPLADGQGEFVDLVQVVATESGAILVASPGNGDRVEELAKGSGLEVQTMDMSAPTALLSLAGPETGRILEQLGAGDIAALPAGTHAMFGFQSQPVLVCSGSSLDGDTKGALLLVDESIAGALWAQLCAMGAVAAGEAVWERARVAVGRPSGARELRAAFARGVIGGEAGAKAEELWGAYLGKVVAVGDSVTARGAQIGTVSSFAPNPSPLPGGVALCCVTADAPQAFENASVKVGSSGVDGSLFPVAATPKRGGAVRPRAAAAGAGKAESDAERAERAAEQLRLMQERARALAEASKDAMRKDP